MGTRGLVGIIVDGKQYFQYNHSSSNPMHLGLNLMRECRATDVAAFRNAAPQFVLVEGDDSPTREQRKDVFPYLAETGTFNEFETRLRGGHKALATWKGLLDPLSDSFTHLLKGLRFVLDYDGFQFSTNCEWAYIVNADTGSLEVYTGNWRSGADPVRDYVALQKPRGRYARGDGESEWGINLLAELPFSELQELPEDALVRYCERLEQKNP